MSETGTSVRIISIKEAEKRLGEIAVLKTHIINYSKTRETYIAYRQSGYSKEFYETHREQLTHHKAAKEAIKNISDKRIPKIKELNEENLKCYRDIKESMNKWKGIYSYIWI